MFNDYEGKNITSNLSRINKTNTDNETQTEVDETEFYDEEVQVIEREENSTQTNMIELNSKNNIVLDNVKIKAFLDKASSLVLDALNSRTDEILEMIDDEVVEEYSSASEIKFPCVNGQSTKNTKVSDMCWNSSGDILAVSFFIDNHQGPCSHFGQVNFYKFTNISGSKTFTEMTSIETNSCIKSIDSHPKNSLWFVCSSFVGEIYLISAEVKAEMDNILYISKIDSYFHKECVNIVKWIKFEENYLILSLSEEGRLLLWDPEEKLNYPTIGFSLKYKAGKNTFPIWPISLAVNTNENFTYIIGTLDGNIYKCAFQKPNENKYSYIFNQTSHVVWRKAVKQLVSNMTDSEIIEMKNYMENFCRDKNIVNLNSDEFFKLKPDVNKLYKNALKSNFEKHISLVTNVEFSPFIKNLFLTSSFDGSIRIYHQNFFVKI